MRTLLLVALLAWPVLAPAQQPAASAAARHADAPEVDVAQNIQDQIQTYLTNSGYGDRAARQELQILVGQAPVQVPDSDADWVMQRSAAFDAALLQAEADYVQQQLLRTTDDAIKTLYQADGQEPPPYDAGRTTGQQAELVRKVLAVANGRLDDELRKLGLDPKALEEAPPPQRHLQLQDMLTRRVLQSAAGELVGLVPEQTFEGDDGKGNFTIGVVAIVSPKMKERAHQILSAHGEITPDPSLARDPAALFADKPALVRDFGLRWTYDKQGLPVLMSFAQWGSAYHGSDPIMAANYRNAAAQQAQAKADAQIAEFLDGSMSVESNSRTGSDVEQAAERQADNYVKQNARMSDVLNGLMQTFRSHAHAQVTGIRTLYTWSQPHPLNKQKIVGVIRMWSAAGEQSVRALRDQRAPAATPAAAPAARPPSVTQGRDLMNASDF